MTAQRADELVFAEALPIGTPEERDLAVAFKRGDRDAYNDIHERYAPRVHSVCRRMLGNPDDAQEAAQEAFLRIYQGLPRFNGRYRLGAWVVRIATNVCLDQLRSRSRKPSDPAPSEVLDYELCQPVEDADPELLFLRHAEGRRIGRVLNSLPPMHRAAIVLRDFEGVSYADIAETLGITEGQVKALLHRARRRFKRTWTANVASLFMPFAAFIRLFKRVEVQAEVKTGHLTSVSHAAESALSTGQQVAMTASQAANACSSVWAQCGQFVVDKAAPIATAVAVSAASVGAGVALSRSRDERPARPKVQAPVVESEPAAANRDSQAEPKGQPPADKAGEPAKEMPDKEDPTTDPVGELPVPPVDDPVVVPPVDEPANQPTPEPSPSPSTPPSPVVPPWAFNAKSTVSSEMLCACDATPQLTYTEVRGKPGGRMLFVQRTSGALLDAEGDAAWAMTADYAGRIVGSRGSLNVTMNLITPFGTYKYQSIGRLVGKYQLPDGNYGYDFVGNYVLSAQTGSSEGMPTTGQLGSAFSVTPEGEVYNASFSLQETSPTG